MRKFCSVGVLCVLGCEDGLRDLFCICFCQLLQGLIKGIVLCYIFSLGILHSMDSTNLDAISMNSSGLKF